MSLRALFWVAFLYAVVWAAILVARDPGAAVAWALPDRFVPADLLVTTSSCSRSGDEVLWSCEAEGAIDAPGTAVDGRAASFRWKSEEGHYLPNGDRVSVRAAAVPVESVPAVAIPPEDDPRAWATEQLGPAARLPQLGLFVMLAAFVLELLGRLLRVRGGDRIEVEHYASSPGCAVLFLGLGVPIAMLGGVGLGWGAALVAIALLAQVRRFVVVDRRERTLARGWQILLFRRLGRPTRFEGTPRVVVYRVESAQPAERKTAAVLRTAGGDEEVVQTPDAKVLEKEARRLAEFLGVPVEKETRAPGQAAPGDEHGAEDDDFEDDEELEDEVEESRATVPALPAPVAYVPPPAPGSAGGPLGTPAVEVVGGGPRSCLLAVGCLVLVAAAVLVALVAMGKLSLPGFP